MRGRPVAVAITGGIAAGKSEALAAFARHGAAVASSDEAVDDRGRIGTIVFADRGELEWLEQLLHPRTREVVDAWLAEQTAPVAVVEIPLLYETGGEQRFDKVMVVTAPPEVRRARRGEFADREARLIPDEEKLARADYAYVNDGSLEELDAFVAGVVEELASSS
jgi:dephospho-CoA kinase